MKLALGVVVVYALLHLAHRFGLPPLGIVLVALVVFEVASLLWAADSRDGRDWPRRAEWGLWKRRSTRPDAGTGSLRRSPGRG